MGWSGLQPLLWLWQITWAGGPGWYEVAPLALGLGVIEVGTVLFTGGVIVQQLRKNAEGEGRMMARQEPRPTGGDWDL